eukprot:scaffold7398_cov277-Pinguiococcus_pyrenoidosus.AAC.2
MASAPWCRRDSPSRSRSSSVYSSALPALGSAEIAETSGQSLRRLVAPRVSSDRSPATGWASARGDPAPTLSTTSSVVSASVAASGASRLQPPGSPSPRQCAWAGTWATKHGAAQTSTSPCSCFRLRSGRRQVGSLSSCLFATASWSASKAEGDSADAGTAAAGTAAAAAAAAVDGDAPPTPPRRCCCRLSGRRTPIRERGKQSCRGAKASGRPTPGDLPLGKEKRKISLPPNPRLPRTFRRTCRSTA